MIVFNKNIKGLNLYTRNPNSGMILNSKKLFLKGYKLLKDQDQYIKNQNNGMIDQRSPH